MFQVIKNIILDYYYSHILYSRYKKLINVIKEHVTDNQYCPFVVRGFFVVNRRNLKDRGKCYVNKHIVMFPCFDIFVNFKIRSTLDVYYPIVSDGFLKTGFVLPKNY